jgi:hypothetical protein
MPRLALSLDTMTQPSFAAPPPPPRAAARPTSSSASSSASSIYSSSAASLELSPEDAAAAASGIASPATTASPAASPRLRPLSCCYSAVFDDSACASPVAWGRMSISPVAVAAKAGPRLPRIASASPLAAGERRPDAVLVETAAMLAVFEPRPVESFASIAAELLRP